MEDAKYPKVLVIACNPFNEHSNNGLTFLNLFRGWPAAKVCQVYVMSAAKIQPDFSVCRKYWRITLGSCAMDLIGIHRDLSVTPTSQTADKRGGARTGSFVSRLIHTLMRNRMMLYLLELARDTVYSNRAMVTALLRRYLDGFQPEVIFAGVGNNIVARLVLELSEQYGVAAVPWFGDDWIEGKHKGLPWSDFWRRREDKLLRQLLARSPVRMVVCEAMASEYWSRYGGEFSTVANLVESGRYDPTYVRDPGATIRFVYVGGLHLGRWKSLLRIGEALECLRASEGLTAELVVHTHSEAVAQHGNGFKDVPAIRIAGFVPNERVPDVLRESEILVHVEGFDQDNLEMTRVTFSTKLPEYLMAGRCILAFGPSTSASIRYVQEMGCGIAVGTDDMILLTNAIRRLIVDHGYRRGLGEAGRALGVERFDGVKQRKVFRDLLWSAIAGYPLGKQTFQV